MIEISVVVPVFNAAPTLDACLGALERQEVDRERYEVLVVDNNSRDGSMAIAARHPSCRLLAEPRQGAYAARNRGLRAARGNAIAFTDPDCVARPDWLRRLHEPLDDPATCVVMGRDLPAGRSSAVRLLGEYDHCKESFVTDGDDAAIYYGHTNNLLARREIFRDTGAFDLRPRGADVIFVQRAIAARGTGAVRYQPAAVVDHLEIRSAAVYFRKACVYGLSAQRYAGIVAARPLTTAERLRVFRDTATTCGLSRTRRSYLFFLLSIGVVAYEAGRLAGMASAPWSPSNAQPEPL